MLRTGNDLDAIDGTERDTSLAAGTTDLIDHRQLLRILRARCFVDLDLQFVGNFPQASGTAGRLTLYQIISLVGPPHDRIEACSPEGVERFIRSPREEHFEEVALEPFAFQFSRVEPIRRFCERRGSVPASVASWTEIPAVPASIFKSVDLFAALHKLSSRAVERPKAIEGARIITRSSSSTEPSSTLPSPPSACPEAIDLRCSP